MPLWTKLGLNLEQGALEGGKGDARTSTPASARLVVTLVVPTPYPARLLSTSLLSDAIFQRTNCCHLKQWVLRDWHHMDAALRQAKTPLGPERRFTVVAEEVTVVVKGARLASQNASGEGLGFLPLPLSNLLAAANSQSFSAYRFKMTRLADGREITFEVSRLCVLV